MLELKQVTKKYGHIAALDGLSFRIPKGETVGLLGKNGAGKTTALNTITGCIPPDEGEIWVGGHNMATESRECKRMIGYLPEQPPLYDEMTVRDYLSFVCDLREVRSRAKNKHIDEILGLCSVGEVQNRIIGHLSKGYRQRIGIAQALCGSPELIVLDEPTVGLDPKQVVEIRELIRKLGDEHTILFSSHILHEVQTACSTVLILQNGKLIREVRLSEHQDEQTLRLRIAGGGETLLSNLRELEGIRKLEAVPGGEPGTTELRITEIPGADDRHLKRQILKILVAHDSVLLMMNTEKDDLEKVFLEATSE